MKNVARTLMLNAIFSFILMLFVESINRNSFIDFFNWGVSTPLALVINFCVYYLVVCFFSLFPRILSYILYSVFGFLVILLSLISNIKYYYRNEYLAPWDFYLGTEALNISDYLSKDIYLKAGMILLVYFVIILIAFKIMFKKSNTINFKQKVISLFLPVTILILSELVFPITNRYFYSIEETYEHNGLLIGFTLYYFDSTSTAKVDTISNVDNLLKKYDLSKYQPENESAKPNVIIIMSEAFWDPTVFKELKFSEDPLPFFHKIQKDSQTGNLFVPVMGGGTANTEFEVLTGFSTQFLQPGIIPYVSIMNQPVESLASIMSANGYKTTAIHPYHSWFYNRDKIYNLMGFDRFIPMEFLGDFKQIGPFLSDLDLNKEIMNLLNSSTEHQFIFGVSMLNHGPYTTDRIRENSINVSGPLSEDSKTSLKHYLQTLKEVDNSLKYLIESLKASSKPTILVFFGDHLPLLGENNQLYKDLGINFPQTDWSQYKKMHETPLLIWNNYQKAESKKIEIGSNYLGAQLLGQLDIRSGLTMGFLNKTKNQHGLLLPPINFWGNTGTQSSFIKDYKLLQYDILQGRQFALDNKKVISPNYHLGFDNIVINSTNPAKIKKNELFNESNGESVFNVFGSKFITNSPYFVSGTKILVNGDPLPTVYSTDQVLSCFLPKKYYSKSGTLDIKVAVLDDKGRILQESNSLKISVE